MAGRRRSIWIPDALWAAAVQAAARETIRVENPVNVSEFIRRSIEYRVLSAEQSARDSADSD